MGTTYTALIETFDAETGHIDSDSIALSAKTDESARKQTEKIARENPGKQVYCRFSRASDGQRGYINRDGAHVTGKAY